VGRLARFLDDGRIEIDSYVVERAIRPLRSAVKIIFRRNGGGEHWPVVATFIEMNGVDPVGLSASRADEKSAQGTR
jgi:transposase